MTSDPPQPPHTVTFDHYNHLIVDDIVIATMSPTQRKFLELILSNNRVITREFMITYLYPTGNEPDIKIFDVMLSHIRRKLKHHRDMIDTVWGRGWMRTAQYRFIAPDPATIQVPLPEPLLADLQQFHPEQSLTEIITPLLKQKLKELYNDQE